ncbi:MAG TPA: DNA replication/repair protein RecF [Streptosporangiaceae bacterium]|nr:DNA replication/repair protein RecF [Streptosporangiaceae bacterium]
MHLTRLALTDFRSYESADVSLTPGITTFTGPNGAGKTNLIEAAYYVATFGSHRVSADAALIRQGADRAILRAALKSSARDSLVEIELNSGRANRVRLNRVPLTKPREALGTLQCVLFAPEDLAIVKGDPSERRRYLDDLLVASRPRYAGVRSDYERVVKQRSALLKSARAAGRFNPPGLEVWDDQLIDKGAELTEGRLNLVQTLRPLVTSSYADVASDGQDSRAATISYRQGSERSAVFDPEPDPVKLAEGLRASLERLRRAELERGVCLVGPHRDELELRIGDLPARGYASHGESWSFALALRLAGFGLLRADGEDPVLMLDDVFAELDVGRRDRLAELAVGAEQVLVTAAVPADVPARLAGTGSSYSVTAGVIERA